MGCFPSKDKVKTSAVETETKKSKVNDQDYQGIGCSCCLHIQKAKLEIREKIDCCGGTQKTHVVISNSTGISVSVGSPVPRSPPLPEPADVPIEAE